MKKTIGIIAFLIAFSAQAIPVLSCKSISKIQGVNADAPREFLYFTAYVESEISLMKAVLRGAYETGLEDVQAIENYVPTAPMFLNYNKFAIIKGQDLQFSPLLPKNLSKKTTFPGYIQVMHENDFIKTVKLNCHLIDY